MGRGAGAREVAFRILKRVWKDRAYANILLRAELARSSALSEKDRSLTTELVYGTLRWQGRIDWLLANYSRRPLERLPLTVLALLRIAVYQLMWLERVPDYAAVDEAVTLAKREAGYGAASFINGVLRAIVRGKGDIRYPELEADPVSHMVAFCSQPEWLVRSWIEQWGEERALDLARAMNERPPLSVRGNSTKVEREALIHILMTEVGDAAPLQWSPEGAAIHGTGNIEALGSYRQGLFTVQDEAAQLVAHLVSPGPGERVLDGCTAPGTKTGHLSQLMGGRGLIVAADVSRARLRLLKREMRRLGITNVAPMACDCTRSLPLRERVRFHRILIDAPCSGSGVIRRHPEGKWYEPDIVGMVELQRALIMTLSGYLKRGGTLVYSVCSTDKREGEEVIFWFLERSRGFRLEPATTPYLAGVDEAGGPGGYRTWPFKGGMDAFFMARLVRK